jgi:hypothetical protein
VFFEVKNALFGDRFSLIACDMLSGSKKLLGFARNFQKICRASGCCFKIWTLRRTSPKNVSRCQPVLCIYFLIDLSEILIVVVRFLKIGAKKTIQES